MRVRSAGLPATASPPKVTVARPRLAGCPGSSATGTTWQELQATPMARWKVCAPTAGPVARARKPEPAGYRAFCEYRDNEKSLRGKTKVSRLDWLAAKRRQIWLRIKRRQQDGILRFSY